jgi:hypothetical protein
MGFQIMKKYLFIVLLVGVSYSQHKMYLESGRVLVGGVVFPKDYEKGIFKITTYNGRYNHRFKDIEKIVNKSDGKILFDRAAYLAEKEKVKYEIKQAECDKNSKVKMILLPIDDDLYGVGDIVNNIYDSLCYSIKDNYEGLQYLSKESIKSSEINNYHLKNIGDISKVDFVGHGYAYRVQIPNKSTSTLSPNFSFYNDDNISSLLASLPSYFNFWNQNRLAQTAGNYIYLTYYFYNVKSGRQEFIFKNQSFVRID